MHIHIIATIAFTLTMTLAACEEIQTRHVTWVRQPSCNAPDPGDPGCAVDMGQAQDMGCAPDMANSGSLE